MDELLKNESAFAPPKETSAEKWRMLLMYCFFVVVGVSALLSSDSRLSFWWCLFIAGGTLFSFVVAVITGISLKRKWSIDQADKATERVFTWIVGAIIIVPLFAYLVSCLPDAYERIQSTPTWAFVIIVLLLVVIGELQRR